MSAFPETGRSDGQKMGQFRLRFQPGTDVGLGVISGVLGTFRRSFGLRDSERCKRSAVAMMKSSTSSKNWNTDSIDSGFSSYWIGQGTAS